MGVSGGELLCLWRGAVLGNNGGSWLCLRLLFRVGFAVRGSEDCGAEMAGEEVGLVGAFVVEQRLGAAGVGEFVFGLVDRDEGECFEVGALGWVEELVDVSLCDQRAEGLLELVSVCTTGPGSERRPQRPSRTTRTGACPTERYREERPGASPPGTSSPTPHLTRTSHKSVSCSMGAVVRGHSHVAARPHATRTQTGTVRRRTIALRVFTSRSPYFRAVKGKRKDSESINNNTKAKLPNRRVRSMGTPRVNLDQLGFQANTMMKALIHYCHENGGDITGSFGQRPPITPRPPRAKPPKGRRRRRTKSPRSVP